MPFHVLSSITNFYLVPIVCVSVRVSLVVVLFLPCGLLKALGHALVHESEEADGAGADAHAVDEAAGEERTEDGAEVGIGDL